MSETLPVIRTDDDRWAVVGTPPGAAGGTVLELAGGMIEVDVLSGTIAAVDVAVDEDGGPAWFTDRLTSDGAWLIVDEGLRQALRLAQLAALVETLAIDLLAPTAAAVAQLELADVAVRAGAAFGLHDLADDWLDASLVTMEVVDVARLDETVPELAVRRLLELCDRLLASRPDRQDLRSLRAAILGPQPALSSVDGDERSFEQVPVSAGFSLGAVLGGDAPSLDVEVEGLEGGAATAVWEGDDLVVTVRLPDPRRQLAMIDVLDGTRPVATVAVVVRGETTARVPLGRTGATRVRVGPNPHARPGTDVGTLLADARAAGRRAAALGWAGLDVAAVAAWASCSEAWLAVPDNERAGLAAAEAGWHSDRSGRATWLAEADRRIWRWGRDLFDGATGTARQGTFVWPAFLAATFEAGG